MADHRRSRRNAGRRRFRAREPFSSRSADGRFVPLVSRVELAPHFQQFQTELFQRIERDDPLITLLTPGPRHEDYFSHAYLSRYLGFQLVEGGDLRVIGSRVYMKTLEGLKPIDLMIRCVQGSHCDPLELDPSGFAGPVGLVQALRKNQRLLMNFLGTSVVENRGLAPHLPQAARSLLGEDLILHEPDRRWLGDMEARVYVFAHPERFVIRHAHEGTGRPGRAELGIMPDTLSPRDLEALKFNLEITGRITSPKNVTIAPRRPPGRLTGSKRVLSPCGFTLSPSMGITA